MVAENDNPVVLVVAGHCGLDVFGEYRPRWKQSPQVPPGIYEGQWNRIAAQDIVDEMQGVGITAQLVNPGPVSIPKRSIVGYVNNMSYKAAQRGTHAYLVEVHANSVPVVHWDKRGWKDDTRGVTIFVSHRASETSKKIAERLKFHLAELEYASPLRGIKTADYTIITKTKCPAVLIEAGFMSSHDDVAVLLDHEQRKILGKSVAYAIMDVHRERR